MQFVRLWVVALVTFVASTLVVAALGVAWNEHAEGRRAVQELAALRDANQRIARRRIPAPQMRTTSTYPAPYNLEIICTVAGSSKTGKPLDSTVGPKPGDLYVKTCRAFALDTGPSG